MGPLKSIRTYAPVELTFGYKTFDRRANLIKADSLTAVGAGLSEVSALKTALERLAQSHGSAILTGQ